VTLFNKIKIFFYKFVRLRIWFASITVILLFLLLALTVNSAREKDIVEIFSRQQLANVQNTATRMADVFSQVGKNIDLFSRFYPHAGLSPEEIDGYYKILSTGWESTFDTIVLFDANGNIKSVYPKNALPAANLLEHFNALRKKQKQYLELALPEQSNTIGLKQKTDKYLIVGYPIKRKDGKFEGAWLVSFALSAVVDKYQLQTLNDELGELFLIDEKQQIIIHRDSAFIGKNVKELLGNTGGAKIDFASDAGGYFESMVHKSDKKQQHSIIAYYPLRAGDKKWTLLAVVPYSQIISPLRKTFSTHFSVHYCLL